jgi:hypothetical protein
MNKTRLSAIFLLAVWTAITSAADIELKVGDKVSKELRLGPDSDSSVVPLPAGEWLVLRVADAEARRTNPVGQHRTEEMVTIILMQRDASDIVMHLRIHGTTGRGSRITQWVDKPCERTNTLYRNPYDSNTSEVRCLMVNHIVGYLRSSSSTTNSDLRKWVVDEHLNLQNTALESAITMFRPRYHLSVQAWVNPALRKLDSEERTWASNPFHRDWIAKDPARQAYVKEFIAWAEGYAAVLSRVYDGSAAGAPQVPAFR